MRTEQISANTSCLPNTALPDAIGYLRGFGLHGITLLAFSGSRNASGELAGFWFREMTGDERQGLKRLVTDFDRIALHSPFVDLPLFSYDHRVEELAVERVKESIEAAAYLGAGIVAVHANARPNFALQEYWDPMVARLRALGEYAAERGVRIGVETGYPDKVEHFVDLIEAIGHHGVGATLDTGHITRYVDRSLRGTQEGIAQLNARLLDLTRQLGPTVIHCHLHDVRFSDWKDHETLGSGMLDFPALLAELQSIGYEGMLELELEVPNGREAVPESLDRLRHAIDGLKQPGRRAA